VTQPGPGVRVVLDARALQEPERAPVTALYLDGLLSGLNAEPLNGESFVFLLRSDTDDPTARFDHLLVVGRRLLPPTHVLRSAAMIVDPFLLRGAALGAAWRADRSGAAGAVYHAASGGLPLVPGIPTVVTLLDLAPWELPHAWQRSATRRFGHRLRAQQVRDANAVIVTTESVAATARRLLHLRGDRLHVVPLAPRPEFNPGVSATAIRAERERMGLPERYFVYVGRFDARHDLTTLLRALASLLQADHPADASLPWPPRVLLAGASPDDRAAVARAAMREGVGDVLSYAPAIAADRLAALIAGARAAILPVVSDAAALPVLESLAAGTPVIASAVGALPEIVGGAGILVEPRDPARLATALATTWTDDDVHARLAANARERAAHRRTWVDVARDTRSVYEGVVTAR
jgi:glycosyltransferase involved in cell wall biosynthesis